MNTKPMKHTVKKHKDALPANAQHMAKPPECLHPVTTPPLPKGRTATESKVVVKTREAPCPRNKPGPLWRAARVLFAVLCSEPMCMGRMDGNVFLSSPTAASP